MLVNQVLNRRLLHAVVLLLAIRCLAAQAFHSAVTPGGIYIGDFGIYHSTAARISSGGRLYLPETGSVLLFQQVSSPLVPLMIRPLAHLSLDHAFHIWVGFNVALLLAAIGLYCYGTGLRVPEDTMTILLLLFVSFRFWPTVIELGIGNCDIILLALIGGMYVCDRFGLWRTMALVMVVAALVKTWMLGVFFYLLARRKWKAALTGGVLFVAGISLLFSVVGWREFPAWIAITHRYSSQPMLVSHSIAGMARMYFSKNVVITPLTTSPVAHFAVLVAGYGALAAGLFRLWLRGANISAEQAQLYIGLTVLALILGSPVCHQFYFVLTLPLLWALLAGPHSLRFKAAAFAIYLVFSLPTPGLNPVEEWYRHGIHSILLCVDFSAGAALWVCGYLAATQRPQGDHRGNAEGMVPKTATASTINIPIATSIQTLVASAARAWAEASNRGL